MHNTSRIKVSTTNLSECLDKLSCLDIMSIDTETTGLRRWHQDKLFSIVISTGQETFYFNYQNYRETWAKKWNEGEEFSEFVSFEGEQWFTTGPVLERETIKDLIPIFKNKLLIMHNAKFDLAMLDKEGIHQDFEVWDTQVMARLVYNDHMKYSLDACAERDLGERKMDLVKSYMDEFECYHFDMVDGKKEQFKNYHFYQVPYALIYEYACIDAELTRKLYNFQKEKIAEFSQRGMYGKSLPDLCEVEKKLTRKCFKMEKTGILIDRGYCEKAIEYERDRYQEAARRFKDETGKDFVDSGNCLGPILLERGHKVPKTDSDNFEVSEKILSGIKDPLIEHIFAFRDAHKRCHTYFKGFLYHADKNDVIHPDMRQAGTRTGRFAYSDPNLQNVTKDEDKVNPFPIRRAFIPRPGKFFVMIDYNQMEFRLMLEYAKEMSLIRKILQGHDPHQATADMTGLTRKQAKTLNFGILYGMGIDKLSKALSCTPEEAKKFRRDYFDGLPMVENLLIRDKARAKNAGLVRDWMGRVFYFPDERFSYKATNAIIQGGSADCVKSAMVELMDAPILLQIHDELLFEVSDVAEVSEFKKIMESAFPAKQIPLTCSIEHSLKSWGDPMEGLPFGEEARDSIQRESAGKVEELTQHVLFQDSASNSLGNT
jgi:DNA polymerase I